MEVVQPTLELVAGILHSDFATLVPQKIEDGGAVDGIFEALRDDILGGVERLALKDAAIAKDELKGFLSRMQQKFQCLRPSSDGGASQSELDAYNAKIRAGLESAQWAAKRGGVGGGGGAGGTVASSSSGVSKKPLAGDERLDTLKWIVSLELLKILNLLTSWNSTIDLNESNSFTFFSKQKMEIVTKDLKASQKDCVKYLQEMNEEIVEVAKFLASKLDDVGVAPKKPVFKFTIDKKKLAIEVLNVNFLVNQFFRMLKTFFGFAVGLMWKNEGRLHIPELAESTRLMGGDPFVIGMNLEAVINNKKLDRILRREAKSRVDAFNITKDPDAIKAIRPKYLEGDDVELVTSKQSQLVNDWMLTGTTACLRGVYLDDDAKDNIREMLQDLMLQWAVEGDPDSLRGVLEAVEVVKDLSVDVPRQARGDVAQRTAALVQEWLMTRDEEAMKAMKTAVDVFCLTRIQPALDFDAAMRSGEIKKDKLKIFLGEMLSFYFDSREKQFLDGICAALNWIGDPTLLDKRETLNLKQNGGDAECSSVYGFDVEISPGFVIRRLDCEPEMVFRDGDAFWISGDSTGVEQWIQRNLKSQVTPMLIAMQAYLGCCAPRDFDVVGRVGGDDEWKTLVAARGVDWRDHQWRFFTLRQEAEVKSVKLRVFATDGGGWGGKQFVQIRNLRMYANQ